MAPTRDQLPALEADWLGLCRRAARGIEDLLDRYPGAQERGAATGVGEGGDMALAIDRAAEDVIFEELEALGQPLTAISEERGEVQIAGGGPCTVVIDPIDGSLNAKRGVPAFAVSIAVASGPLMGDVEFGWVHDLGRREEWLAMRGRGAWCDGEPLPALDGRARLEILGIESAHPDLVARAAGALAGTGADRLRAIGSIALSLCWVAAARFDAMVSLRECRSVDAAAGALIAREVGASVRFPAFADPLAPPLDLSMRSPVAAAGAEDLFERLVGLG